MRILRQLVVLVFLLVLSAGCELRLQLDVVMGDSGGGDITVLLAADAELARLATQAGVDPLARLAERIAELDGPWSVEERDVGGDPEAQEVLVSAPFADPAEFAVLYGQMQDALDAPEATLAGPMVLVVDEEADTISLSGEAALAVSDVAAADLGVAVGELTDQLAGTLDYQVRITTPVPPLPISTHLGVAEGEDQDGRHIVTLAPAPGQVEAFDIVFTPPGLNLADLVIPVGGGVGAVTLIGFGIVAERRRHRPSTRT